MEVWRADLAISIALSALKEREACAQIAEKAKAEVTAAKIRARK